MCLKRQSIYFCKSKSSKSNNPGWSAGRLVQKLKPKLLCWTWFEVGNLSQRLTCSGCVLSIPSLVIIDESVVHNLVFITFNERPVGNQSVQFPAVWRINQTLSYVSFHNFKQLLQLLLPPLFSLNFFFVKGNQQIFHTYALKILII